MHRRNSADFSLQYKVLWNSYEFSAFLDDIRTPGLEVEVKLAVPAFRSDHQIGPRDFDFMLRGWFWFRSAILVGGGKFKVVIRAWPGCLAQCLMMLVSIAGFLGSSNLRSKFVRCD